MKPRCERDRNLIGLTAAVLGAALSACSQLGPLRVFEDGFESGRTFASYSVIGSANVERRAGRESRLLQGRHCRRPRASWPCDLRSGSAVSARASPYIQLLIIRNAAQYPGGRYARVSRSESCARCSAWAFDVPGMASRR